MLKKYFSGSRSRWYLGALGAVVVVLVVYWIQGTESGSATSQARIIADRASIPSSMGSFGVPTGNYTLLGTVSKVADGDTVTLIVGGKARRVRLDSIDAPEFSNGIKQIGQPYSEAAQKYLHKLVIGKTLTAQCYEKDQYSREVCTLMLPDGSSVNRKMVESGHAWAYTAHRGEYLRDDIMPMLQHKARNKGLGLWAQQGATEPWVWRYECWRHQQCEASESAH